jgi:hypothetical protein
MSSSPAPSTPSDSRNPFTSRTTSDSTFLPESQSKSPTHQFKFQRSPSDSPNSSRRPTDSLQSLNSVIDWAADQKRHSQHSATSIPTSKQEERGSIRKKHHSHKNIYTECGRHSDDWLLGGFSVTETVKRMLGKKR